MNLLLQASSETGQYDSNRRKADTLNYFGASLYTCDESKPKKRTKYIDYLYIQKVYGITHFEQLNESMANTFLIGNVAQCTVHD